MPEILNSPRLLVWVDFDTSWMKTVTAGSGVPCSSVIVPEMLAMVCAKLVFADKISSNNNIKRKHLFSTRKDQVRKQK
jgi:hypothetical protein